MNCTSVSVCLCLFHPIVPANAVVDVAVHLMPRVVSAILSLFLIPSPCSILLLMLKSNRQYFRGLMVLFAPFVAAERPITGPQCLSPLSVSQG